MLIWSEIEMVWELTQFYLSLPGMDPLGGEGGCSPPQKELRQGLGGAATKIFGCFLRVSRVSHPQKNPAGSMPETDTDIFQSVQLVVGSQLKGETKHPTPKSLNNNKTKSCWWVGWYNCEFRVIPLPPQTPTKAWLLVNAWTGKGKAGVVLTIKKETSLL